MERKQVLYRSGVVGIQQSMWASSLGHERAQTFVVKSNALIVFTMILQSLF